MVSRDVDLDKPLYKVARPWGEFEVFHENSPLRRGWLSSFFLKLAGAYPGLTSDDRLFLYRDAWLARVDGSTKATVKIIRVNPKSRLSLQSHGRRSEEWFCLRGVAMAGIGVPSKNHELRQSDSIRVLVEVAHRLSSDKGAEVLEIAMGEFDENDITRFQDDYGRAATREIT